MNKLWESRLYKLALIVIFGILAPSIYSQQTNTISYRPETGCWMVNTNNQNSNSTSSVWQFVQTPVTAQITDIIFVDSSNGWACHTGMGALKTTDSGFNWTTFSFNDTSFTTGFNGIYFLNANTGWTVGGAIQIRKTTNSGLNWVRQIPPPVAGIAHSVYFIDVNTGYICGSKNFPYKPFVAKTTNGGVNWTELSPTLPNAQELRDQYWFNASTGWLAGYDVLLYTTNGGTSFTDLYANIPPSGNGHISLLSIQFVNSQTGWIGAANLERNNVYRTTNGGQNWAFQNNPISQGGMNQINDVLFLNPDTGWAAHGTPFSGAIMYTSNGGTNWSMEEQSVNWFDCMSAYSNKKIWCGSSAGKVWYALFGLVGISSNNNEFPNEYMLYQNYPNPFNPLTKIRFGIPPSEGVEEGFVKIIIFNILGDQIATLVNEQLNPGTYEVDWNAANYPSGVYYYKLTTGDYSDTKKMILIK
jgi:photosystem II stability/assembly factor-like uncharacterized protein